MPGRAYREYIELLSQQERIQPSVVAHVIAATWMIPNAPDNEPINQKILTETAGKLVKQPAFIEMMKDPEVEQLVRDKKGLELVEKLAAKETELSEIDAYKRPEGVAREDGNFLKTAIRKLKEEVKNAPPMLEKQTERYNEMIRQMEAAEQKCSQGIALSGEEARALATAVKKYNDKGSKVPGGVKKAVGYSEAMCIMHRFMPKESFARYCREMSAQHKVTISPDAFGNSRLYGDEKGAEDLRKEYKKDLVEKDSVSALAAMAAISKMSAGNKEAPINRRKLDEEVKKLVKPGSAFMRAMADPAKRANYRQLAQNGKLRKLGDKVFADAQTHAVRSATYQFNRSVHALTNGPTNAFMTQAHLANILAAHEMAATADANQQINLGAFRQKASEISQDPAFQRVAERYQRDPDFRDRMNQGLTNDGTASSLQLEYHNEMKAANERQKRREARKYTQMEIDNDKHIHPKPQEPQPQPRPAPAK